MKHEPESASSETQPTSREKSLNRAMQIFAIIGPMAVILWLFDLLGHFSGFEASALRLGALIFSAFAVGPMLLVVLAGFLGANTRAEKREPNSPLPRNRLTRSEQPPADPSLN